MSRHVTLPLCENTARFIKLRLRFGGRWLLITEITFNSGVLLCFVALKGLISPIPVFADELRNPRENILS